MPQGKGNTLPKTKYSDKVKVAALAEYDVSHQIRPTAAAFQVPPSTLMSWIKEREAGTLEVADLETRIAQTKKALVDKSITIMDKALDVIERKIDACSAPQAATVYGILPDKVQAIQGTGGPEAGSVTNNIMINGLGEEEASRIMQKVLARMKNGSD
jgi:hypothetical protein